MKNELVQVTQEAIQAVTDLGLPNTTNALTPTQYGWLRLCKLKADTYADLQKDELQIQALLTGKTWMETPEGLAACQEAIKTAKGIAATAIEKRKYMTGLLTDQVITPAMAFEKRMADTINAVSANELLLRKAIADQAGKTNAKANELAALKTHIENEYFRIAASYRHALKSRIAFYYMGAMDQAKMTADELATYKQVIADELPEIELSQFVRFTRNLVMDAEAMELFKSMPTYDAAPDLKEAIKSIETVFEMYDQDIENAAAAKDNAKKEADAEAVQVAEEIKVEAATNVLMNAATAATVVAPVVKVDTKITPDNTEKFAMMVLATAIKNWPEVSKKLGVKTWTKLVDPFTKALDKITKETGQQFTGFNYTETEK